MGDVDDAIQRGVEALTTDAPDAPAWERIERKGAARRRRRTVAIGLACAAAVLIAVVAVANVGDDDTNVVAGPTGDTIPCDAWIAVHTLFDSSANRGGSFPGSTEQAVLATVTAEQAAFLVKSGDVPDRVAGRFGGNPADLAGHVVAKPNSDLGTIEITAWAGTADKARALSDAFAEALLDSVHDIQLREIDRQRGVIDGAIAQLQAELAGVTGDDRAAVAQRDRLNSEISHQMVARQELDQRAAQGSNLYSFGSSEAFLVTSGQADAIFTAPSDTSMTLSSPPPPSAPNCDPD